jgi:hypothetical protein
MMKGFVGPFKLETFQHEKYVNASNSLLVPGATPLATCEEKKMDTKILDNLKALFNVAYCIAKNNKRFSDFSGLLA